MKNTALPRTLLVLATSALASACGPDTSSDTSGTQSESSPDTAMVASTADNSGATGAAFKPATLDMPGRPIWEANCKVCHGTGLAGAPVIGDKDAWGKRLPRGKDEFYEHALNGWGDMPARGGNPNLTDEQVTQAVDFMVAQAEP